MKNNSLEQKVLDILITTAQSIKTLNPDSADYSVTIEALSDWIFLLTNGCDDEAVNRIIKSTACDKLHDVLIGNKKRYTVTIEEHISGEFIVHADNLNEALRVAELNYRWGVFVVKPTVPHAVKWWHWRNRQTKRLNGWSFKFGIVTNASVSLSLVKHIP